MPDRPPAPPAEPAPAEPDEVFPPTLREVMLRPQWLAMLALCLVVAGVFAWLGQWQLGRAVDLSPPPPGATEQVRPLDEVAQPGQYLPEPLVGQRVRTSGTWVPGDFLVVSQRYNDGVEGYWVTGQLRLSEPSTPTSLAVAVGWTDSRAEAEAAASALSRDAASAPGETIELTGRLISDEGPALPPAGADPQEITRMSPPALLSRWHDIDGLDVYRPYLTSAEALGGLQPISSPAPAEGSNVNWLNIFYAAEWAVFAGFAFYLWYRLARDAWEREVEDLEEPGAGGAPRPGD
jgi:cytochrome oxidase assembly protein ShyY1